MRLPISLCVIVLDDPLLEGCLASVREWVTEICVYVTAPLPPSFVFELKTRGLIDKLQSGTVLDPEIDDFSFCEARNRCLTMATQPWWMWLDSDDRLRNPERLAAALEHAPKIKQQGKNTYFMFPYEYAYAGEPGKTEVVNVLPRERLFENPKAWRWWPAAHEVCVEAPGFSGNRHDLDSPVVEHHRTASSVAGKSSRNLRILKKYCAKHPNDLRCMYYLGTELLAANEDEEAFSILTRYVELGNWDDERMQACLACFNKRMGQGQPHMALTWALKALSINESAQEPYFALARAYYDLGNRGGREETRHWQRCVKFARLGLEHSPTVSLVVNPLESRHFVYEWLNVALSKLGDTKAAKEAALKGLEARDNNNLRFNIDVYDAYLERDRLREVTKKLVELQTKYAHPGAAQVVPDIVKEGIAEAKPLLERLGHVMRDSMSQSTPHGLDIVFACGDAWETWNPDTVKASGIGGSETAVMMMAREFVRIGHRVRVYTSCGVAKTYEGVEYYPTAEMSGDCDLLIAWRDARLLRSFQAPKKWLWIHDVYAMGLSEGDRTTLGLADKILTLSSWHAGNVKSMHDQHGIDPSRVVVTRNGIDLQQFQVYPPLVRDPYKCVYSSSPDRGLEQLLELWPLVTKELPQANLHIFYGFQNWEKADPHNGVMRRIKEKIVKQLTYPGMTVDSIAFHGRVNQGRLAREFLSAGVWTYPSWVGDGPFFETNCISRYSALAGGCRIVTSPVGALETSLNNFEDYVRGDARTPQYQEAFAAAIVRCIRDTNPPETRTARQEAAKQFSWRSLAEEWDGWLRGSSLKMPAAAPLRVSTLVGQDGEPDPNVYVGVL